MLGYKACSYLTSSIASPLNSKITSYPAHPNFCANASTLLLETI
jgi:hypothetical protein